MVRISTAMVGAWAAVCGVVVVIGADAAQAAAPFKIGKVADTSTQVPNQTSGTLYTQFGIPSLHAGVATYRSDFSGTAQVAFLRIDKGPVGGPLTQVANANTTSSAVTGDVLGINTDPAIYNGVVAWQGPTAFLTHSQNWKAIPGGGPNMLGQSVAGLGPSVYLNNVGGGYRTSGFINALRIQGQSGNLVEVTDVIQGGGGKTVGDFLYYLDHNNKYIAFVADTSTPGQDRGIYRWDQPTDKVIAIADSTVAIPGQSGTFNDALGMLTTRGGNSGLSARPSLTGKTVVFSFDDSIRSGVYRNTEGSIQVVADTNTPHPTLAGTFDNFRGVSAVGGSTAFVATGFPDPNSSTELIGLYLKHCNKVMEILRQGQTLDGKTVRTLELGHRGLATTSSLANPSFFNFGMEVAFWVEFTDFSEGIYSAKLSELCVTTDTMLNNYSLANLSQISPNGLTSFTTAAFDQDFPLAAAIQVSTPTGRTATFGSEQAAGLYGVNGAPGNNPNLIDFAIQGGAPVPELLEISFTETVRLTGLDLGSFDPGDSVQLILPGSIIPVTFEDIEDGHIHLDGVTLPAGATLGINWDPTNVSGDGVSFNGVMIAPVPEPASIVLAMFAAASLCIRQCRTTSRVPTTHSRARHVK